MVDGGEGGVQGAVSRGQRLDELEEPGPGLLMTQDGQAHHKAPLRILSTHQNLPEQLPHQSFTLLSRRARHL